MDADSSPPLGCFGRNEGCWLGTFIINFLCSRANVGLEGVKRYAHGAETLTRKVKVVVESPRAGAFCCLLKCPTKKAIGTGQPGWETDHRQ